MAAPLQQGDLKYLRRALQSPTQTVKSFHLVICEDGKYPECLEFETLVELTDKLRLLDEQRSEALLFMFSGSRMLLSKGPNRHLLMVDRDPIPLLSVDEDLTPDPVQAFAGDPPPAEEEELEDEPAETASSQNALGPRVPASEQEWGDWGSPSVES